MAIRHPQEWVRQVRKVVHLVKTGGAMSPYLQLLCVSETMSNVKSLFVSLLRRKDRPFILSLHFVKELKHNNFNTQI